MIIMIIVIVTIIADSNNNNNNSGNNSDHNDYHNNSHKKAKITQDTDYIGPIFTDEPFKVRVGDVSTVRNLNPFYST